VQKFQIWLKSDMKQPRSHCKVVVIVALEDLLQRRKRHYLYYISLETSKIGY
jgi:hypothetical protein